MTRAQLDSISNTPGAVLYRDNTQWQGLPPGSASQFLRLGADGITPEWATVAGGGGGGAWSFISRQTATSVAQLDVAIPTDVPNVLVILRVRAASGTSEPRFRVTTDNFTTVKSGASDYRYTVNRSRTGSVGFFVDNASNVSFMQLTPFSAPSALPDFVDATFYVAAAGDATKSTYFYGQSVHLIGEMSINNIGGSYRAAETINGLRFFYSGANIAEIEANVYGQVTS